MNFVWLECQHLRCWTIFLAADELTGVWLEHFCELADEEAAAAAVAWWFALLAVFGLNKRLTDDLSEWLGVVCTWWWWWAEFEFKLADDDDDDELVDDVDIDDVVSLLSAVFVCDASCLDICITSGSAATSVTNVLVGILKTFCLIRCDTLFPLPLPLLFVFVLIFGLLRFS